MNSANDTIVNHRYQRFTNTCSQIMGLLIVIVLMTSCNKTNGSSNEEKEETMDQVEEDVIHQNVNIGIKLIHPESLEFGEPMRYSLNETSEGIIIKPHSRNLDACNRSLKSGPGYSFKNGPPRGLTVGGFYYLHDKIQSDIKHVNRGRYTSNRTSVS